MRFEKEKDGEDYLEGCSLLTKIVGFIMNSCPVSHRFFGHHESSATPQELLILPLASSFSDYFFSPTAFLLVSSLPYKAAFFLDVTMMGKVITMKVYETFHWVRQDCGPVIRLAHFLWLWFQSVCPLMPSWNTYRLSWISLILDLGYLFTAAPAKRSPCSLPWTWGSSSRPPPLTSDVG